MEKLWSNFDDNTVILSQINYFGRWVETDSKQYEKTMTEHQCSVIAKYDMRAILLIVAHYYIINILTKLKVSKLWYTIGYEYNLLNAIYHKDC